MDDAKKIWETLVRYSIVANGSALAFSVSTITKTFSPSSSVSIDKTAVWLFVCGIVLAWLHLMFSWTWNILHAHVALQIENDNLKRELEGLLVRAGEDINLREKVNKLRTQVENSASSIRDMTARDTSKATPIIRNMQEVALWGAYIFFIAGVIVGVAFL